MPLTDTKIRSLRAKAKRFKAADTLGLYIEIAPNGSKLWRFKFRFGGKENRLSFGPYPEVSLADARRQRDNAKALLREGKDPSLVKKRAKLMAAEGAENSFERVAEEYLSKMERDERAPATIAKARWFLKLMKPTIGRVPITEVDARLLLAALKKQENKSNLETAKKMRSFASRVFRFAIATGRAKDDPAILLNGVLASPKVTHHAAILKSGDFGEFLRKIEIYTGGPIAVLALKIAPHVFLRPGELRQATWGEINFERAVWEIPAARMKARQAHSVPLSAQVLRLLRELHEITGPKGYLFTAAHTSRRPMSENTMNSAYRRMGYGKEEVTAHGLRATASTLLNESNLWNPDAIERALAHGHKDAVRGAYHRGGHWDERITMAQWWSDHLDALRADASARVIEVRPHFSAIDCTTF